MAGFQHIFANHQKIQRCRPANLVEVALRLSKVSKANNVWDLPRKEAAIVALIKIKKEQNIMKKLSPFFMIVFLLINVVSVFAELINKKETSATLTLVEKAAK